MIIPILYLIIASEIVPMKVNIGDPIIEAEITSLDSKEKYQLQDVMDEGFCFFFSAECNYCKNAYANVSGLFNKFYTIILFVNEEDAVREFLKQNNGRTDNVYLVDQKYLEKYKIVTFPGVITYRNGRCRTAMHGPMDPVSIARLVHLFERKKPN